MYYFTDDHDGSHADVECEVKKFQTFEEMTDYVSDRGPATQLVELAWGEAWYKSHKAPRVGDPAISPFSLNQIRTLAPGSHPGGREYWVTPKAPIYGAVEAE